MKGGSASQTGVAALLSPEFWSGSSVRRVGKESPACGLFTPGSRERAVAARGGTPPGGGTALTCQVTAAAPDHRHHLDVTDAQNMGWVLLTVLAESMPVFT